MRHVPLVPALALSLAACAMPERAPSESPDPFAWLEDIGGERSMAAVKDWNDATAATLTASPRFAAYRTRAEQLLDDSAQIATPDAVIGDAVFNLWRDARNPRGLWRMAEIGAAVSGRAAWRTLIDVDALGRAEGKSWVWGGAVCRKPAHDRCMVALANGGTDAMLWREFDVARRVFVDGGFVVPEAKSDVAWDGDDLLVATDFGTGSLTSSGYPRTVRRWAHGTPLGEARLVAEGEAGDVAMTAMSFTDGERRWPVVVRQIDFYTSQINHVAPDGRLVPTPLPADAEIRDVLDGRLIASLGSPWGDYPAGALVAYSIDDLVAGGTPAIELVFAPRTSQAVEQVAAGELSLWVKILDNVSGKLLSLERSDDGKWTAATVPLPASSTVTLNAAGGIVDMAFVTVEGMLTPPTLYVVAPGGAAPNRLQSLPDRFPAATMTVEQRFATSADGTKVPYYLVRRKGLTGPVPTLVHAYGGFRLPQTPTYLTQQPYRGGPAALFWVEGGNAYVLANIRGGGEFGPVWHAAALKQNRQRAFDDLHAVAEDLIAAGIAQPGRIGVSGRSNGGLLAGVAITQRPDLWRAAVIGSPLADMRRYSHLLAGASWIGEYGDPDKPEEWAWLSAYSPYHNLRPGIRYAAPLIYTSTRDDRVHPAHARKLAAQFQALGLPFYYYENIEGGHAAGADRREDAYRAALIITYLNRELRSEQ